MQYILFELYTLSALIYGCFIKIEGLGEISWPQRSKIVLFCPLDNVSKLKDVSDNAVDVDRGFGRISPMLGPFGVPSTAYTSDMKAGEFYVSKYELPYMTPSFTFSFYLKAELKKAGGIFGWNHNFFGGDLVFGARFNMPDIIDLRVEGKTIAFLPVLKPSEWTFVAITFDNDKKDLLVYDELGTKVFDNKYNHTFRDDLDYLYIGGYWDSKVINYLGENDAIACFMHYNTALTADEVKKLPAVCGDQVGTTSTTSTAASTASTMTPTSPTTTEALATITAKQPTNLPTYTDTATLGTNDEPTATKLNEATKSPGIDSTISGGQVTPTTSGNGFVPNNVIQRLIPLFEQSYKPAASTDQIKCNDFSAELWSPPPQFPDNPGKPLPIRIGLQILALKSISNVDETVTIDAGMCLVWKVNTCPYDSVTSLSDGKNTEMLLKVADPKVIWKADAIFVNNAEKVRTNFLEAFLATMNGVGSIDKNGKRTRDFRFYSTSFGAYSAKCNLDMRKFPFDMQTCRFQFALSRSSNLIDYADPLFAINPDAFDGSEWRLIANRFETQSGYKNGLNVSTVDFIIDIERIPNYYIRNYFVPSCLLALLSLAGFLLQVNDVNRLTLILTLILALTVNQGQILNSIPKKSEKTLLEDYIRQLMWYTTFTMIYQVAMVWVSTSIYGDRPLKRVIKGKMTILRLIDVIVFLVAFAVFIELNISFLVEGTVEIADFF